MSLHGMIRDARLALWLRKARRLRDAHEYEAAAGWIEAVLEIDRDRADAKALAGEIRTAAVARARERAAAEDATVGDCIRLATWMLEDDDADGAAEALDRAEGLAADHKPREEENAELRHLRGRIDYHQGRYREALAEFSRADGPAPLRPERWYYRGLCHLALGEHAACIRNFTRLAAKHQWAIEARLEELREALAEAEGPAA